MDLLFKRYASPFSFINGYIQTGRFTDFVHSFIKTIQEEKEEKYNWEFYIHSGYEGSYSDFLEEIKNDKKNKEMSEKTIEETVKNSMNILQNFNPEGSEE